MHPNVWLVCGTIQPKHFPAVINNSDIDIQVVTNNSLEVLLDLQYQHDLNNGMEFAKQKVDLIKRQFEDQNIQQALAFYKGSPTGYVNVMISSETAEIDSLMVDEGENTPREMYRKQNYQYHGFKYEALKVYQD
ncbi:hypothetical protein [Neobacillus niacini]|uniref:hypothetical protein n=1 Tax=Neobacillus niacini TaxID=86668 RepID=UPI0021CB6871|nr:hypothetical protein [Neobacillus niacini]MCM3763881.1 hypothetical protein [Neobacillus niacini]